MIIYKYTDDINTATLLEANGDGEFTISPEYNYYLSLPEDIIEWAVQKVGSGDSNSFTMYARMTLQYSTRLDSDEEIYTKRIQTLQRIIFITNNQKLKKTKIELWKLKMNLQLLK